MPYVIQMRDEDGNAYLEHHNLMGGGLTCWNTSRRFARVFYSLDLAEYIAKVCRRGKRGIARVRVCEVTEPKTHRLGEALSVLAIQEAHEIISHEDVDAMGAPSECHDLVARREPERAEKACQGAEKVAGITFAEITRQAQSRGGFVPSSAHPRWQVIVSRAYVKRSPFYEAR